MVGFEKALGAVKVIKYQIQHRSQSLLNFFARSYFSWGKTTFVLGREGQRCRRRNGLIGIISMLNEREGQFYKPVKCKVTRQLKIEARMGSDRQMVWHWNGLCTDKFWHF